jgi:phage terminase Nu1 subunit (DNA packaging protein)
VQEWAAGATKARPGQAPGSTLVEAQLGVAEQRREALALANAVKRGELVSAAAAKRAAFDAGRIFKEAVLPIPDRVSAEFAGETDAAKIFARLTEELARALEAAAEVLEHGD